MPTFHIHIQGQVQGVGFRPFVYKKAIEYKIKGRVNNSNTGVHIDVEGDEPLINRFYKEITENPPELSIITKSKIEQTEEQGFKYFEIVHSESNELPNLLLTPDYGICKDCLDELFDVNNRRYLYPFITCTNCGPRYSIIKKLPYDRENTTMENFMMCERCQPEYENPLERRYYSQTNSCTACAVELSILGSIHKHTQEEIIWLIQTFLKDGKIAAVKGIGGYLLLADATNADTIKTLRQRKHRPTKPFALMYPKEELLFADVSATKKELETYNSIEAPIVLFSLKPKISSNLQKELIAPGLNQIGVMKAYTPLHAVILKDIDFPIIATSANVSDSPIIYDDEKALTELSGIADFVIANNREIVVPQDDSVVKFSPRFQQKIIIRRSRSLAPTFIDPYKNISNKKVLLAMGAGLKSSFAFYLHENTYISQYLGNLNSFESQESFEKVLFHFFDLFQTKPGLIVTDMHQQYFSTQFGKELSAKFNTETHSVQHHKAHFAAVLAENGLINSTDKILGTIWDGVGLGDDGNIWGGEFFAFADKKIKRLTHFEYFTHIAIDKFAMEPRLPAFSLSCDIENASSILKEKFDEFEWKNYQQLINKPNKLLTSSVGRLFDAVASLLNTKNKNSFEGEAAMMLENNAMAFYRQNKNYNKAYLIIIDENKIQTVKIIEQIVNDIQLGTDKNKIAFKFHLSLLQIIKLVADNYKYKHLAFSGGVFQNSLLVDLIYQYLAKDYKLYFHKQLSPNDENISFGQLVYINNKIK
jgi:hydrogenase maturation protein HypF